MSKKKLAVILLTLLVIVANILIITKAGVGNVENNTLYFCIDMESDEDNLFQVFYDNQANYSEEKSYTIEYNEKDGRRKLNFEIRPQNNTIRIALGSKGANIRIYGMELECSGFQQEILLKELETAETNADVSRNYFEDNIYYIRTLDGAANLSFIYSGDDLLAGLNAQMNKFSKCINVVICFIIDVIFLYLLFHFKKLTEIPLEILRERKLIFTLSKNDFKTRFAGSYLGIIWAFIQPIVTTFVYWFVFEKGLRAGRMVDYPFVLWLMCGMVPWFYFSDALNGGTNALIEYSYLVKKVVFKISILPFVKVLSNIFIHLFFVVFIMILHMCYGYMPNLCWLQLVYYMICTFALVLSLSYLTSALVVFFRDLTQIISIILQIGMWATPIMWDASQISQKLDFVLKINPVYYIVHGYRDALLAHTGFWNDIYWTVYFWIFVVLLFLFGQSIFKKLRMHFADVL